MQKVVVKLEYLASMKLINRFDLRNNNNNLKLFWGGNVKQSKVNAFYFSLSYSYCSHANNQFSMSQWQKCLVTDPWFGYTDTTVQTTGLLYWQPNCHHIVEGKKVLGCFKTI